QRVAAEDVAHVGSADDHELLADFFGNAFEPRRAHLARRADRETIAGDEKGLPAMDPRAEVGHEIAKSPCLPALVERVEALRNTIGCRSDLIGSDRVELLARDFRVPKDERLAAKDPRGLRGCGSCGAGDGRRIE